MRAGPARWRVLGALALLLPVAAAAQSLPTAAQVVEKIGVGWNIGNTLEVPLPGGETGWGNPKVTQQLIDGVKAAGFNAVRIPCAWDSYADASTHVIQASWLARVKEVVDYCVKDGLYVVLNIHWDGGWLENHPLAADQARVNEKQKAYWTQIANAFKSYDEHVIFAGMNEVNVSWAAPTAQNITAQQSYLQTFVDAVRATGGNNSTRPLVVQTYSTNIGYGLDHLKLPADSASNRLIVEVHYYDPYDYTGNESSSCLYWGSPYPAQSACAWAQESWLDDRFSKAKAAWVDKGVPVIVGEYGPMRRMGLTGQQLKDHLASRAYYLKYLNAAAARNGLKTFYWDNGVNTNNASALFDRNTGAVVDQDGVTAILQGAGISPGVRRHTLTAAVTGPGHGAVASSPSGISCGSTCSASFADGTRVTLTATPDGSSTFTGWSGACSGSGACTVTMTAATSVTATFAAAAPSTSALTITKAGSGAGTVSSSSAGIACGSSCSASLANGATVTLTATPDPGSTFAGWSGACNGTGTCTLSMTTPRSVTATFAASAASAHAVMVNTAGIGGGTVDSAPSGIRCGGTCSAEFSEGTSVTLTAIPDPSSSFAGWSGACSGAGTCTVSATAARSVTATFDPQPPGGCASTGAGAGTLQLLAPACTALLLRRRRRARG